MDIHRRKRNSSAALKSSNHKGTKRKEEKKTYRHPPLKKKKNHNGYTHRSYTVSLVKTCGIYSLGYSLIYIWGTGRAAGRPGGKREPQGWGDRGGWTQIPPAATSS